MAALYSTTASTETGGYVASALLDSSDSVSVGTSYSWVDFPLTNSYTCQSGTTYGLAIMGNVQVNLVVVQGTGVRDHSIPTTFSSGFLNPFNYWGSVTTNPTGAMSIYASGPFEHPWTRYSICIRLMGIVPVVPTHEITFTTFTFYAWSNATQPVPGKDYVFLYPTGADSNVLYVENQPGLSNFTATNTSPTSTNQIGWGTSTLDYVVNLNLGSGVITFNNATWTFTSGAPITGTFKGSFFGTLQNSTATGFVPAPYPGSNFKAGALNMNNLTGVFHSPNGETLLAYGSRPAGSPSPFTWTCTLITP